MAIHETLVARDLTDSQQHEQQEEGITNMQSFTLEEILTMISRGEIVDGVSIAVLTKFLISENSLN